MREARPRAAGRRTWWISSGVVLLIVAGIATVVVRAGHELVVPVAADPSGHRIAVPLPVPRMVVDAGTTYTAEQSTLAAAASGHGAALDVWLFAAKGPAPACTTLRPSARVVEQSVRRVVVAGFTYRYRPAGASRDCIYVTVKAGSSYHRIDLSLYSPLGHREVVDAATGRELGVVQRFHDRRPRYVPPGYTVVRPLPDDPSGAHRFEFSAANDFQVIHQYERGRHSIEIQLDSAAVAGPESGQKVISRPMIGGHHGAVFARSYGQCLSWDDGRGFGDQVCALPARSLPVGQLIRIARSVH